MENTKRSGFTGIEILIALVIIGAISSGVGYVFKDEISSRFKKSAATEEQNTVNNPFPAKPSEEKTELPKEISTLDDDGGPIVSLPPAPKPNATGEWHGQFTVTAPPECAGESGGWEANLVETNGVIRGNFTTDSGLAGSVGGNSTESGVSWGIGGGGAGVNFKGSISGNTMSGGFTGLVCDENPEKQRSTGTYFGGRIVK